MASIVAIQDSTQATNSTSHSVVVPANYGTGNLGVIAMMFRRNSNTFADPGPITPPSGWIEFKHAILPGSGSNYGESYVYIKTSLGASEQPPVFTSSNAVTSSSMYLTIGGVKQLPDSFVTLTDNNSGATLSSSSAASDNITTAATQSLLVDIIAVLGGTTIPTQTTSGWTTSTSSSTVIAASTTDATSIGDFTGPVWSWGGSSRRFVDFRIALPTTSSNIRPAIIIDDGFAKMVIPGQTITLTANAIDYDGTIANYNWSSLTVYDSGNLPTPSSSTSTCQITIPDEPNKVYVIGVVATDNQGQVSVQARIALAIQNATSTVNVSYNNSILSKPRYVRLDGVWH